MEDCMDNKTMEAMLAPKNTNFPRFTCCSPSTAWLGLCGHHKSGCVALTRSLFLLRWDLLTPRLPAGRPEGALEPPRCPPARLTACRLLAEKTLTCDVGKAGQPVEWEGGWPAVSLHEQDRADALQCVNLFLPRL
jgi:hypothetical protein